MAIKPRVKGKYEKIQQESYMGTLFTWAARYIKDEESKEPWYILDDRSVNFEVNQLSNAGANYDTLMEVSKAAAKRAGYK